MKRVLQRGVALLALVAVLPAMAEPPGGHRIGDGIRVDAAPLDLPDYPEVVEVGHGLVWLVLENEYTARTATKVGPGVYLTAAGWSNASRAFDGRGRRLRALESEVGQLRAQLAAVPPARECPELAGCPTLEQLLPAGVQVVSVDEQLPATAPPTSSPGLGLGGALVVFGLGLVAGAVGGAYLTARALR